MDRLLSERGIADRLGLLSILGSSVWTINMDGLTSVAKAQLAKADKEWVEWGEGKCPHVEGNDTYYKRWCIHCWQERKRSVGI